MVHDCYKIILFLLPLTGGCSRKDFLNAKPDQSLVVPHSIWDLQQINDNDLVMNGYFQSGSPSLGATGADNYYVAPSFPARWSAYYQSACIWNRDMPSGTQEVLAWDLPYRRIYYANQSLEGLAVIQPGLDSLKAYNTVKGGALFFRAISYYELAQVFAPAYDSIKANTDWGLPLRLTNTTDEKLVRSTVKATYDQILKDLQGAAAILPPGPPLYPTRPSLASTYALLARVYQTMERYDKALLYADSALQLRSTLMSYTDIPDSDYPFKRFNPEVIFAEIMESVDNSAISYSVVFVDSNLYRSYAPGDLRRTLFFRKHGTSFSFSGYYDEEGYAFCGLAVDELYLIRAECRARAGLASLALSDLNTLLQQRWDSAYIRYTGLDSETTLRLVLAERRKELLFRGLRWTDLRRLNKDPRFADTLRRGVGALQYVLPPGDPRYTFPIPDNVIAFNPGMPQNSR